jgi:hypothetical protein
MAAESCIILVCCIVIIALFITAFNPPINKARKREEERMQWLIIFGEEPHDEQR